MENTTPKLMTIQAVISATSLSRSTIYALINEDRFPKQIQLSTRRVAWLPRDIAAWMDKQAA